MPNKNIDQQTGTNQPNQAQSQSLGSPISNEAYNVIASLHKKLQGLEAMEKFAKDGDAQIWKQLTQLDTQAVAHLVDELERIVKEGKLRMGAPGRPSAKS
jgi:hypothetical protein